MQTKFLQIILVSLVSVFPNDVGVALDVLVDLVLDLPLHVLVDGEDADGPAEEGGLRLRAEHEHLAENGAQTVLWMMKQNVDHEKPF